MTIHQLPPIDGSSISDDDLGCQELAAQVGGHPDAGPESWNRGSAVRLLAFSNQAGTGRSARPLIWPQTMALEDLSVPVADHGDDSAARSSAVSGVAVSPRILQSPTTRALMHRGRRG